MLDLEYLEYLENLGKADVEAIADEIWCTTNSTNRLEALLQKVQMMDFEQGYQLFKLVWPTCDVTGPNAKIAAEYLNDCLSEVQLAEYLSQKERQWFEALPDNIRVYRGSDTQTLVGLSWTTSKETALQFALGHRCIFNETPVLLSGFIRKHHVLMADNSRNEFELLTDFKMVSQIRVVNYYRQGNEIKPRFN